MASRAEIEIIAITAYESTVRTIAPKLQGIYAHRSWKDLDIDIREEWRAVARELLAEKKPEDT